MNDASKLAAWFEAHAAPLALYARQWLGERTRAEDVVQEVFLRLMAQTTEPANVRAWLHTAVRNAAIEELRSAQRRHRREQRVRETTPAWFDPRAGDLADADAVQRAVAALPPRQREVVTLRVWSGMTLGEISQVTGLAVSTAHDEYRRGLEGIRRAMEKPCTTTSNQPTR
jgi:RNA polymerase sigma-70 factor, ECF subfamily